MTQGFSRENPTYEGSVLLFEHIVCCIGFLDGFRSRIDARLPSFYCFVPDASFNDSVGNS
jgi:hypothetical protein